MVKEIVFKILLAIGAFCFLFLLPGGFATAAATVAPATGGTDISADKAANAQRPAYTRLGDIVITEGATGDFAEGKELTLILTAPKNWSFEPEAGEVAFDGNITSASISVKERVVIITYTVEKTNKRDTLTISRLQVCADDGSLLPSAGDILRTSDNPGTGRIDGIIDDKTNFGSLSQVVGAKYKLAFITQPPATAVVNADFIIKPVVAVQDQFGNTVTTDSTSTIARTAVLSTQVCGGTPGSGVLTSTPASGARVRFGIMAYTAMQYSVVENIKICATSRGARSALSNAISVQNPIPTTTSIDPTSKIVGDEEFVMTVNGTNFISSSTVNFAGSARATTFINSGRLTAVILASDLSSPGIFNITVTNPLPGGGTSNGQVFTVNHAAVKFVIMPPINGTTDNPVSVTVQAQKIDNSVDITYQNDVTLNVSGSATGGGLVDIVNGVGTINISDTLAETIGLSLSDSQGTGLDVSSTQNLTFAPGAVANYSLSDVINSVAGERAAYVVSRSDQHGNLVTSGASTIYLYSSSFSPAKKFYDAATDGNIITSINIADGQSAADFWYYDEISGTYTISASDNSFAPDGNVNVNDAVDSLVVTAATVNQFSLNNPGDVNAGTRLGYTVTRKDRFNNPIDSGNITAYLYSSSDNALFYDAAIAGNIITSIDIAGGRSTADFWYYDETPGTYTITASDNPFAPDGATGVIDATD
ncbi:MAG: hypothetical protein PHG23_03800, partial [Candidatus Pacebacteria bacterium]|nr:hypothetical protein [Candidatus Paceibacterota bacterium]